MNKANPTTCEIQTGSFSELARGVRSYDVAGYVRDHLRGQKRQRGHTVLPLTVGIDLDSTLAKIDEPWLGRLNKVCGTNYSPADWTDWDLGFLKEEERKILFELFTPDLYDEVEPYEGACEAIRDAVEKSELKMLCVTTNPSKNADAFSSAKKQWLKRYFPGLANSVVFSKAKSGLGLDVLIDDAPHHFQEFDYIPVLVERPWNLSVDAPLRFQHWNEGKRLLLAIGEHSCSGLVQKGA